jgi:hypothetical protein
VLVNSEREQAAAGPATRTDAKQCFGTSAGHRLDCGGDVHMKDVALVAPASTHVDEHERKLGAP